MRSLLAYKNLFYIVIGILGIIIVAMLLKTCEEVEKEIESKTVTIIDTAWLPSPIVTVPQYFPVKDTIYIDTTTVKPVASTNLAQLTTDYNKLVATHYQLVKYKDSVKLKDTAYLGKDLGTVYIEDVVSQNELKTRNIRYQLKYPVITNTITTTNTIKELPKNQLYIGGQLMGSQNTFINQINAVALFKNKKDLMFGGSIGVQSFNNNVRPQFGVLLLKKISLK